MTVDENEVAANIALGVLDRGVASFSTAIGVLKGKLSAKSEANLRAHKRALRDRYGHVRTLMHRDRPIPLADLYVAAGFYQQGEQFSDDDVIRLAGGNSKILLQGTAGGGKSVFMRFLNLVICESDARIVPIFLELRSLNNSDGLSIIDSILKSLKNTFPGMTDGGLRDILLDGRAVLMLDGFDEISYTERDRYAIEINEIGERFPEASIIVTSRPEESISSLETFLTYRVLPFEKEQATELLSKLPYDEIVKEKFISAVSNGLYEKHRDFLSNPLLITMMLMTYHQFAEIPSKVHIFYQQAFETLFSWHDSAKDVFKRKSYTQLPIDEFQRAFSYFCMSTYSDQMFTFESATVLMYLNDALAAENISCSADDFLKDLLESTCLLQRDGLQISFVHRSFQEFFTAMFVVNLEEKSCKAALNIVVKRTHSDLVMPMAYEMKPALVERAWCLPTINALIRKVDDIDAEAQPLRFFSVFFQYLTLNPKGCALMFDVRSIWGLRLLALRNIYRPVWRAFSDDDEERGYQRLLADITADRNDVRGKLLPSLHGNWDNLLRSERSVIDLNLRRLDEVILDYYPLAQWAVSQKKWFSEAKLDIQSRIELRNSSIGDILSKTKRQNS